MTLTKLEKQLIKKFATDFVDTRNNKISGASDLKTAWELKSKYNIHLNRFDLTFTKNNEVIAKINRRYGVRGNEIKPKVEFMF